MRSSTYLVASALASAAAAENYLGFSTGSTKLGGSAKSQSDFQAEFSASQSLVGAPGVFNAARLYTNIQGGTTSDPIEAFGAAVSTNTKLLLGIWASGTTTIEPELTALKAGLDKYGSELADLVIGISIGSEDLYRNSQTGASNDAGVGAEPDVLVGFINDYREAFASTLLKDVPVGHVDTWNVFPNASNKAVIDAVDWVGLDEYPFYETGKDNTIENAPKLFQTAYDAAKAAVGDKPMWITETGWPYKGKTWDQGVPSVENAKTYWDTVGCAKLFNKVPTFWYDLTDDNDITESFAITDNLSANARFNLTCPADTNSTSSSSAAASSGTGVSSGSGSGNSTGSSPTTLSTAAASGAAGSGSSGSSGSSGTTGSGSSGSATSSGSSSSSTVAVTSGSNSLTLPISAAFGAAFAVTAFLL